MNKKIYVMYLLCLHATLISAAAQEQTNPQDSFIMPPMALRALDETAPQNNLITRSAGKHPARQRRHSFTDAEFAKHAKQERARRIQTLHHEVLAMHIPSYSSTKPPRHPQRHRRNSSIGNSGPSDSHRSPEHSTIAPEYSDGDESIPGAPAEPDAAHFRPIERQDSVISARSQRRNSHDQPVPERSDEGSEHSHASHAAPHGSHHRPMPRHDSVASHASHRRLSREYRDTDLRDIIRASHLPGWSIMFIGLSSCYETHPKLTIAGLTLFGILLVARKIDFKKLFAKPVKPEKPKDETVQNPKPKDDETQEQNPKSLDFQDKTTHTKLTYDKQK